MLGWLVALVIIVVSASFFGKWPALIALIPLFMLLNLIGGSKRLSRKEGTNWWALVLLLPLSGWVIGAPKGACFWVWLTVNMILGIICFSHADARTYRRNLEKRVHAERMEARKKLPLLNRVALVFEELFKIPLGGVTTETELYPLFRRSRPVMVVEGPSRLAFALEREFDLVISYEDAEEWATFGEVVEYVESCLAAKVAA